MPLYTNGIPESEKGAPNGVAELDSSGKVLSSELPTLAGNFVGEWDATTNTPTLSDATGTVGHIYAVSVAGTQDLGSGSIVFAVGDELRYDDVNNRWVKIPFGAMPSGASPTGQVGLNTVNGSAATYMRSDAAPPLNQGIAPNWSAIHTFGVAPQVVTGADGNKLWLAKYVSGTDHNNAPTSIGAAATYLYVGGREYGNNGWGGIGFSYISDATQHPAVWIGWEEKNTGGNTNGDFVVATRSVTTNTAPTERLRITATGQIISAGGAFQAPVGAQNAPGLTFSGATDAGLFYAANMVNIATQGTNRFSIGANGTEMIGPISTRSDGTAANPAFSFQTDAGMGIYKAGLDSVGLSTDGTARLVVDGNGVWKLAGTSAGTTGQVLTSNGTSSPPTWETPSGNLNFDGNLGAPTHHTSLLTNINASDGMVHTCDGSAGDMGVFLPDSPATGKTFTIIRQNGDAHGFDIHAGAGALIYGPGIAGVQSIGVASQGSFRTLYFDGTNWWTIATGGS